MGCATFIALLLLLGLLLTHPLWVLFTLAVAIGVASIYQARS